jgi:iron(III) transport system ATP-binding protein
VAGVERPTTGCIQLRGAEVAGSAGFVAAESRRVGMVFQDYALFPHLTVAANVAFGLKGQPRAEVKRRVAALLERVDLSRHAGSYPHQLSGGERQRVALARAIAPRPQLLLMDEPFSSLDGPLRESVRQQTVALLRDTATTTLMVTHDPEEALRIADRIALLDRGRLVQCAPPEELYQHPTAACAARVFGPVNELRAVSDDGSVETPLGRFAAPASSRGRARVFIRPHAVHVSRRASGPAARVIRSTFLGNTRHVHLEVPGLSEPLVARVDGAEPMEADAIVFVRIDEDAVIVLRDE